MGKSLLYARSYPVNDKISIRIPTVGEILENEVAYNSILSCVISTPYDFMVYLDDMGIDFEKLTEYDLFLLLFPITILFLYHAYIACAFVFRSCQH